MKFSRLYWFVLLCFIAVVSLPAQDLTIDGYYTIDEGLSNNRVTCILQDSTGFIWIGTSNGLNKFDGYEFKVYQRGERESGSLSSNEINALCMGDSGQLWIATNYGVNIFNPQTNSFRWIIIPELDQNNQAFSNVYRTKDGYFWFKTQGALVRYHAPSAQYSIFNHFIDEFQTKVHEGKEPIFEDSDGMLWVGSNYGLHFFDRQMELFQHYNKEEKIGLADNMIRVITEDNYKNLWLGNNAGLIRYMKKENTFYPILTREGEDSNPLQVIRTMNKDELFLGFQNSMMIFNVKSQEKKGFTRFLIKNYAIQHGGINDAYMDRTGLLWIGTNLGLMKIDTKEKKFKTYNNFLGNNSPYYSNAIKSILVEDNDILWLGSDRYGLYRYDRRFKASYIYTDNPKSFYKINSNKVTCLNRDKKSQIWVGTSKGINLISDGEVMNMNSQWAFLPDELFTNKTINFIFPEKQELVWVGTNNGLFQIDANKRTFMSIDAAYLGDGFKGIKRFHSFVQNHSKYYLATNIGVLVLDVPTLKWSLLKTNPTSQSIDEVYSLLDTDSNLFIGTEKALIRYNKQSGELYDYSRSSNLKNVNILGILADDIGFLWLSTNKGLYRFNPISESTQMFTPYDGLQSYEFYKNSCYKSNRGELFFGGSLGVNSFFADSVKTNLIPPPVVINKIEFITQNGIEESDLSNQKIIYITSDVKLFTLTVSALDFTNSMKNNYAYKLSKEGTVDDGWVHIGNNRKVSFSNLAPGSYLFQVKGSNNDLIWGNQTASLRIIVKAPFYKTTWAYVFYVIFGLLAVGYFIRLRFRRLHKINRDLKEKEKIAKEISRQKEELSIRNQEMTDSLRYAKRIQEAMMPQLALFQKHFSESFVFYSPKAIVSGDFYWVSERDGKVFVAAVDCTGHGVPGAFMSLIGIELFRNITSIRGLDHPSQILNILNQNFAMLFNDEAGITIRDGMDVSIAVVDKANKKVEFAGAMNSLFLIRDYKVLETKGNRFSIGLKSEENAQQEEKVFTNHVIDYLEGDVFYVFSDGYVDQFGGPNLQKYKKRRFRHLLLNIHKYPLQKQKQFLEESFDIWKGEQEQVDDILVIGFKP